MRRQPRGAIPLERVIAVHETASFLPEELDKFFPESVALDDAAAMLNWATAEYAFNYRRNSLLDQRAAAVELRKLAISCSKSLSICGIYGGAPVEDGELYPSLGPGQLYAVAAAEGAESGRDAVNAALKAVDDLRRWAVVAGSFAKRKGDAATRGAGRRPDAEAAKFMDRVAGVFERFHGERASVALNEAREPSGLFFDLLVFAHKRLHELGLAAAVKRSALAQRWFRSLAQDK